MDSTVKEGRFQGCEGDQAKRASLGESRRKHERVSGRKSCPGRSAESWFHSNLAKPEMRKEIGRQRAHS